MIAVTGSNGLLGRFIIEGLSENSIPFFGIKRDTSDVSHFINRPVTWKDANLTDFNSLLEALSGAHLVIHAAGLVSFKANDGEDLYRINVEGTRNVVNACLSQGVKRLIHISSVAALGRQKGVTEIDENNKWVESNLNSEYAESKYLAELEVYRGQEEGLEIDIVNPSVILSRSNWNNSSSQLFKYVWQGRPFYTEGTINYVDVRDVVKIILALLSRKSTGGRIIANAGSVSIKELFDEIAYRFKKKSPHLRIPPGLVSFIANLEILRSRIVGSTPIVSPQYARTANEKYFYKNSRAINLGINFLSLPATLDWCCPYYLENATTKN